MIDEELAARALEILGGTPYFNVATASDDQLWNPPAMEPIKMRAEVPLALLRVGA